MINKFILTIFFLIFYSSIVFSSEQINKFEITGNDRISNETIIDAFSRTSEISQA